MVRVQPYGIPDPTFGRNGRASADIQGFDGRTLAVLEQADGKVVAGGTLIVDYGAAFQIQSELLAVARFLADGRLDATFGADGRRQRELRVECRDRGREGLHASPRNPSVGAWGRLAKGHTGVDYDRRGRRRRETLFGDVGGSIGRGDARADRLGGSEHHRPFRARSRGNERFRELSLASRHRPEERRQRQQRSPRSRAAGASAHLLDGAAQPAGDARTSVARKQVGAVVVNRTGCIPAQPSR